MVCSRVPGHNGPSDDAVECNAHRLAFPSVWLHGSSFTLLQLLVTTVHRYQAVSAVWGCTVALSGFRGGHGTDEWQLWQA